MSPIAIPPSTSSGASLFTSPHLSSLDLESLKESYDDSGFVVIPSFLSPSSLGTLRLAAQSVTDRTRSGQWPHRRIVGKRFPPYEAYAGAVEGQPDVWGVQHLLHPEILEGASMEDGANKSSSQASNSKVSSSSTGDIETNPSEPRATMPSTSTSPFLAFYADAQLLALSSVLLGCSSPSRLQLELFNLLIEPKAHTFALPWHRDDVRSDVGPEEEQRRLNAPTCGVQWNVALWDDDCLFVVPGSQKRVRSEDERRANEANPPPATPLSQIKEGEKESSGIDGNWDVDPPTTLRVKLKAGDAVFYSQRILHRASYVPSSRRATLHGCYGALGGRAAGSGTTSHGEEESQEQKTVLMERARNILQHDVSWMRDEAFGASLPDALKPMWANLVDMDRQARESSDGVGYSLEG